MLDLVIAIGSGDSSWLRTLFPNLDVSTIIPFETAEEVKSFIKAFKLLISTMYRDGVPLRMNILCFEEFGRCWDYIDGSVSLGEIIAVLSLESISSPKATELRLPRRVTLRNLLLVANTFEDVYRLRNNLRSLALRTNATIVMDVENVVQDLDLMLVLQNKIYCKSLYIVRDLDQCLLKLAEIGLHIDTLCFTKWLHYNVMATRSERINTKNVYTASPNYSSRVLMLTKGGLYLSQWSSTHVVDIPLLRDVLRHDYSSDNISSVIRSIEPTITFRLKNGTTITEEDIELLRLIDTHRSIRAVMKKTNLNYVAIKKRIEELERALGVKIVVSRRGGVDKGVTELTPIGKSILEYLESMLNMIKDSVRDRLALYSVGSVCTSIDFP